MEEARINDLKLKIENWFCRIDKALIALSGGIDSSLVAFVSRKKLGRDNTIAVISASASVKRKELVDARNFCNQFDIILYEIDAREIDDQNYRDNPVNRCFFCKSALYNNLDSIIKEEYPDYSVLNGNNFSDMGDFRPGMSAAENHKVLSPLAKCGFTKEDIRLLAKYYQLPNWNKPASPCLSSRFPYGTKITEEKLRMVELAEDTLNLYGFNDVRVRYIVEKSESLTASIEVPYDEIEKLKSSFSAIESQLVQFGFETCKIDPEGLVSGKLNRKII